MFFNEQTGTTNTTTYGMTALHYPTHNMLRARIIEKESVTINGGIRVIYDILNGEDENNPEVVAAHQVVEAAPDAIESLIKQRLQSLVDARRTAETITVGMEITL
jgi:hypothetical protein